MNVSVAASGWRIGLCVVVLLGTCHRAHAQSAENVAVVVNEASAGSQRIGEYYVRKRAIPQTNVIRIRTSVDEEISRAAYAATIEQPIAAALVKAALQDRILYIVLTKGVPIRVAGTTGLDGTVASVDSELTLLYRKMTGKAVPVGGRVDNPYYLGSRLVRDAQRFTHRAHDIFLVSRLDAFTVDEALAVIDRAQAPVTDGQIVLDQRGGVATGDDWLEEAARRLEFVGFKQVLFDQSTKPVRDIQPVLGYYSWGSNDPANRVRRLGMGFVAGSIAATYVSTDARTLQNPPDTWVPSDSWKDTRALFGGSPQTLIGDLLRDGATGVAGHVAEPYLQSTVRPSILFPTYVSGFNLIEAFYLAIPHLSWQTVVIGDPLCAPFQRKLLSRAEIEDAPDPQTELPALFSARRTDVVRPLLRNADAKSIALSLAAEARLVRNDLPGARRALEAATEASPAAIPLHLQLALLYERLGEDARARERYRVILKLDPKNAGVLNNLAYSLAIHEKNFEESAALARQAVSLAPTEPTILDTLGWIEHLRGNTAEAAKLLTAALQRGRGNAEIHLHAAIIFADSEAWAASETQLQEALRFDPTFAKREDVRRLQRRLAEKK